MMRSDNKATTPEPTPVAGEGMTSTHSTTPDASITTHPEWSVGKTGAPEGSGKDAMSMTPEDFASLRSLAADVSLRDVHMGRVLDLLVLHLGHLYGLDPAQEDERLAVEERAKKREQEDTDLKTAEEGRKKTRAAEDAAPATPEQSKARAAARAAEDQQLQSQADERKKTREQEDAATKDKTEPVKPDKGGQHAN